MEQPFASADRRPDAATLIRTLRRLVYTDKLLSLDAARNYCDAAGIPRGEVDPKRDS